MVSLTVEEFAKVTSLSIHEKEYGNSVDFINEVLHLRKRNSILASTLWFWHGISKHAEKEEVEQRSCAGPQRCKRKVGRDGNYIHAFPRNLWHERVLPELRLSMSSATPLR